MKSIRKVITDIAHNDIQVLLLLVIISAPLIISTFDTGWFSDDYQVFFINQTKHDMSNPFQLIKNFLEPRSDYHLIPIHNIINYLLIKVNSSSQWIHIFVISTFILTGFILFKIICKTHKDRIFALFCSLLFIISYDLSIKSLVFHCLHYNTTNTLTGLVAFYYVINYMSSKKLKDLVLVLLFLLLSIFNYESGFVFLPIIGVFIVSNYLMSRVNMKDTVYILLVLFLSAGIYAGYGYYFTNKIFPIYTFRSSPVSNQDLIEKQIKLRDPQKYHGHNKSEDKINQITSEYIENDLTISELRSTYAPKSLSVMLIRSVDLSIKILNYSFIEGIIKNHLSENEKIEIKKVGKKLFKILAIIILFVSPLVLYMIIKNQNKETIPFLISFIAAVFVFVVLFNRVDVANSISIFSSVLIADIICNIFKRKNKYIEWKYIGYTLLSVLLIGPIYNMATGFSYIYPFKKEIMFNTAKIYNEINKTIGGYTENSLIYIHKKSSIFSPGLSFYEPSPLMDLSHLNARLYQNQFIQTDISKKYINKSVQEFQYAPELIDNIKSMIVLSIDEAKANFINYHQSHIGIFVDSTDTITLIE
jgi:hypothetical protein